MSLNLVSFLGSQQYLCRNESDCGDQQHDYAPRGASRDSFFSCYQCSIVRGNLSKIVRTMRGMCVPCFLHAENRGVSTLPREWLVFQFFHSRGRLSLVDALIPFNYSRSRPDSYQRRSNQYFPTIYHTGASRFQHPVELLVEKDVSRRAHRS